MLQNVAHWNAVVDHRTKLSMATAFYLSVQRSRNVLKVQSASLLQVVLATVLAPKASNRMMTAAVKVFPLFRHFKIVCNFIIDFFSRVPCCFACLDVNECSMFGTCGYGAECVNLHGSYKCLCPDGYSGDPYRVCAPNQVRCSIDSDCSPNEKCVQPGNCICPPPYFTDINDSNKCKSTSHLSLL